MIMNELPLALLCLVTNGPWQSTRGYSVAYPGYAARNLHRLGRMRVRIIAKSEIVTALEICVRGRRDGH